MTKTNEAGVEVQIPLENTIAFAVTQRCAGDSVKENGGKVQTDADKNMFSVQKKLFESKAYEAIKSHQGKVATWLTKNTVQMFGRRAIYLISKSAIADVDKQLQTFKKEKQLLTDAFLAVYPTMIEEAKKLLNSEFNSTDYKTVNEMSRKFDMTWFYISLAVSDNIPEEMQKQEVQKFQDIWQKTAIECREGLRLAFVKLLEHLNERLQPTAEGKAQRFHESNIENLLEFINTLERRNLTNDVELAKVANQVKDIVKDASAEDIRKSANVRKTLIEKIAKVSESCDTMISTVKARKFNLDE